MYELNYIRHVEREGIQVGSDIALAVVWYEDDIFSIDFMDVEPSMQWVRKATREDKVKGGYYKRYPWPTTNADDTAILKHQENQDINQ